MNDACTQRPPTASEVLADWLSRLRPADIPDRTREVAGKVLLDIAGLCVAARRTDYTASVIEAWESEGSCTLIGHARTMDAAGAALVNGMAAHGEDFDDTFEGAPLHAGAAGVPPLLAICERYGRSGADLMTGLCAAIETMCRLALVAPGDIHRAGFQPAAVLGTFGAAAGVGVALGLDRRQLANALGIAGSFSSGLMEFLAEGAWTKRIHPGWAGQSGLRAALLARSGFTGPRAVLEGRNGFFRAFARIAEPRLGSVTEGLGEVWRMDDLAFKVYPCGTMIGPYIDCAIMLRESGVAPEEIVRITCKVAAGVAARQWEPLAEKQSPSNEFSAKFSGPFGLALGLVRGRAGLADYTEESIRDPALLAVTRKIAFEIDPSNPFPERYTGDLEAELRDGTVLTFHQPHLRGGRAAPPSREDLLRKFEDNIHYGGWSAGEGEKLAAFCAGAFDAPDLGALKAFRM